MTVEPVEEFQYNVRNRSKRASSVDTRSGGTVNVINTNEAT